MFSRGVTSQPKVNGFGKSFGSVSYFPSPSIAAYLISVPIRCTFVRALLIDRSIAWSVGIDNLPSLRAVGERYALKTFFMVHGCHGDGNGIEALDMHQLAVLVWVVGVIRRRCCQGYLLSIHNLS